MASANPRPAMPAEDQTTPAGIQRERKRRRAVSMRALFPARRTPQAARRRISIAADKKMKVAQSPMQSEPAQAKTPNQREPSTPGSARYKSHHPMVKATKRV